MNDISPQELEYQDLRLELEQWYDRCQFALGLFHLKQTQPRSELKTIADDELRIAQLRQDIDQAFANYLDTLAKGSQVRRWEGLRFADLNHRLDLIDKRLERLLNKETKL